MGFDQMHIKNCILYQFKKGSKASQAARNIRSVYKNEASSIRTCQRWFKPVVLNLSSLGGPFSVSKEILGPQNL